MRIFAYLAFSALLAMSVLSANAQNYDKGLAAYYAGDYQTAFKELMPLAEQGKAEAQFILGSMHYYGRSVVQDRAEAFKWFRLAASNGSNMSQLYLGLLYQFGDGVEQDNIRAHMWYNIASANGLTDGPISGSHFRSLISLKMRHDNITKAESMATECVKSGYEECGW